MKVFSKEVVFLCFVRKLLNKLRIGWVRVVVKRDTEQIPVAMQREHEANRAFILIYKSLECFRLWLTHWSCSMVLK